MSVIRSDVSPPTSQMITGRMVALHFCPFDIALDHIRWRQLVSEPIQRQRNDRLFLVDIANLGMPIAGHGIRGTRPRRNHELAQPDLRSDGGGNYPYRGACFWLCRSRPSQDLHEPCVRLECDDLTILTSTRCRREREQTYVRSNIPHDVTWAHQF